MKHNLKTWPEYFQEVVAGNKRFEVRNNDRNYQVGDTLMLLEWDPETKDYTGGACACKVVYMLNDPQFVKEGTVVMSIDFVRQLLLLRGEFEIKVEEGDNQ